MTVFREQGADSFSYTLRPNCSLNWTATKRVMLGFAACMGVASAYWVSQGAWLVLPFFGLELGVLALGLYLSALAGSRREVIEIAGPELRLSRGGRRLQEVARLPRHWSRVVLVSDPTGWYPSRLMLSCHGRRVEIGSHLVEHERLQLAEELEEMLGLGPSIGHRRPAPAVSGALSPVQQVHRNRESTWQ